jgi:hypothetical protein
MSDGGEHDDSRFLFLLFQQYWELHDVILESAPMRVYRNQIKVDVLAIG